jgi:hypothetical protein
VFLGNGSRWLIASASVVLVRCSEFLGPAIRTRTSATNEPSRKFFLRLGGDGWSIGRRRVSSMIYGSPY